MFLVDSDTPGFHKGRKLNKLGLKGQDTAELFFEGDSSSINIMMTMMMMMMMMMTMTMTMMLLLMMIRMMRLTMNIHADLGNRIS